MEGVTLEFMCCGLAEGLQKGFCLQFLTQIFRLASNK